MSGEYTRTGNGWLAKLSAGLSYIPFVGGFLSFWPGMVDTAFEALGWLARGKVMSAITAFAAGTVETTINSFTGSFNPASGFLSALGGLNSGWWWLGNAGSGLTTGRTIGSHARALTENVIGGVTGAVGMRPTVLRSYTAGIGYMQNMQARPGYWATRAAQERGQDPNARYAAYRNGDGADHVAALESAAAGNYRGM